MSIKIKVSETQYIIPHSIVGLLDYQSEEINKKRIKLIEKGRINENLPEIKFTYQEISDELLHTLIDNENISKNNLNIVLNNKERYCVLDISSIKLPNLNDWEVLGMIEKNKEDESFIITSFSNEEDKKVPITYHSADPTNCDHCGHNRKRNSTFILRNAKTTEEMQVGKSCMKDFVNNKEMDTLIFYTNIMSKIYDMDIDLMYGSSRPIFMIPKLTYLAAIDAIMDKTGGFIGAKNDNFKELRPSTATGALHITDPYYLNMFISANKDSYSSKEHKEKVDRYAKMIDEIEITEKNLNAAKKTLEWFKTAEINKNNEFEYNMATIMNNSSIHLYKGEPGRICYCFKFIEMQNELALKKLEEKETKIYSTTPLYIGDEGDKISSIDLKLVGGNIFENDFGNTYAHFFETRDGRSVVWFASNSGGLEPLFEKYESMSNIIAATKKEDIWVNVKASIKERKLYKEKEEQTLINRVKPNLIEVSSKPLTNGLMQFDEKYTLNEFKIKQIEESITKTSKETQYKYTVEDKNNINYFFFTYEKLKDIEIGTIIKTPTQDNHGEIVGILPNSILIIEDFSQDFEPTLLTVKKAQNFGVEIVKKDKKKNKP